MLRSRDTFLKNMHTIITIMFGSNDSVFEKFVNQFVDVDSYRQNLKEVIKIILGLDPNYKVVLITPPPICDKKFLKLWPGEINRSYNNTKKYADAVRALAQELIGSIHFIDLWDDKVTTWDLNDCNDFADGLHFSPLGHIKFANILKTYFDANFDILNKNLNNFAK